MRGGHKFQEFFELNSFRIVFKKSRQTFAMVLIIEFDKDNGDRVQGLSVELTEGAKSLFDKIDGPRSFQPMWVVDILTGMQTKITSVNVGFDGHWLSIFIRLEPKGRKHMLISTKTCKVKWRRCSCLLQCVNQTNDSQ
jgi:hypothetical protein